MIAEFQEYQKETNITAIYPKPTEKDAINYCIIGLIGEAGELANKFKKCLRDDSGVITAEKREELISELGDVLWYCSQLATELKVPLDIVAELNISKLRKRFENNTIKGSGDNR